MNSPEIILLVRKALTQSESETLQERIRTLDAAAKVLEGVQGEAASQTAAFLRAAEDQQLKFKNLL